MAEPRTVIVTGASAGVGKAAARQLVEQGWRVIGIGRDPARCAQAEEEIGADLTMLRADLNAVKRARKSKTLAAA